MTLTDIQFKRSWQLAIAHKHEWAMELVGGKKGVEPALPYPAKRWTIALIAALVEAARPNTSGERAVHLRPVTIKNTGAVINTTPEGLTWTVYKDGRVRIEISRPDLYDPTYIVDVTANGTIDVAGPGDYRYPKNPCHASEINALAFCLAALCGVDATESALTAPRKGTQGTTSGIMEVVLK